MTIFRALLAISFISGLFYGFQIWRSAGDQAEDSQIVVAQLEGMMTEPARDSSREEISKLLLELGPYRLPEATDDLEFGFAVGTPRDLIAKGPKKLVYIRGRPGGRFEIATRNVGPGKWKTWHRGQSFRAGFGFFRSLTLREVTGAWFEVGTKIQGGRLGYLDSSPNGEDILYCFPACVRAEGRQRPPEKSPVTIAIPFFFGPRAKIVQASNALSMQ